MRVFRIAVCSVLLNVMALAAPPPISLKVSPFIGRAPQLVRLTVTVEPNEANREVCVVVDGPVYRSSCYEHVGAGARRTTTIEFRDLPEGRYGAVAVVGRVGGQSRSAEMPLCVLGLSATADSCFGED